MGNSLFDQLKKTGLVDKTRAQKVKRDQYKNKKQKTKKGSVEQVDEVKLLAEKTQAEKVERDRQINKQKEEEAERKAIAAQIIQLIETNRVEDRDGEIVYNFTDANVVKRLFVSERSHKHLMSGHLSIAKLGEGYELVPKPVAEKIKQRDAECIINIEHSIEAGDDSAQDEDDPYADYKIPDDLIW
ncbi:MAG: DUF2058 domain-containing protein [Gammaproteobacteria bacterium]|nr:DUF2058 domain-containing protein [Gammaproteobacteria bacterium]